MKVLPIIFSGDMVKALLDGRKTQTRRTAYNSAGKPTPWLRLYEAWQAGERDVLLYVREKHWAVERLGGGIGVPYLIYDDEWDRPYPDETAPLRPCGLDFGPHPSIHMFRWASRLTLRVTDVRLQKLQDISDEDAEAEGMREPYLADGDAPFEEPGIMLSRKGQFRNLWKDLHGAGAWAANPPVVPITFETIKANVDDVLKEAA